MTIPFWAPFLFLASVCAVYPPPRWTRRVDWLAVTGVAGALVFIAAFWINVALLVARYA